MLPENKSLQIHKVAADGIGQQSPGCYHKIRPEPGRKPRNVPLGMSQLVIIQVKQQAAVVIEHRRHSLDLHGVGIKQDAKVAQVAVNIEDNRIQNHPLELTDILDRSYEKEIINQKYDFIEEVINEVLVNKSQKAAATDKIDRYLTHRWLGLPIFLCIMALVFFLTFTIGDWLKGYFEILLELFSGWVGTGLNALQVNEMLQSLILDGIISGVGGILTFLPNIFILFLIAQKKF